MKKNNMKLYVKPAMQVTLIRQHAQLLAGSGDQVQNVDGNAGIDYGGGGAGPAFSRESGGWDDDADE